MRSATLFLVLLVATPRGEAQSLASPLVAGAAEVDVTPTGPIRLSGYGSRTTESNAVEQRLFASALALGELEPVVIVAVENCGVPAWIHAEVARRLGLPRARLTIAATHTHSGPMLPGMLENLFAADIPADQLTRIEAYGQALIQNLTDVGRRALAARAPTRLAFGRGRATFATNRRTAGGPSDHDVEVLRVEDETGALLAIVANYACHCTTLGGAFDRSCGDWAGYARETLVAAHPGAVVLITVGCGGDQNPAPRGNLQLARDHGWALAAAVERELTGRMRPIEAPPVARRATLDLPFDAPRTREEWEARAAQGGAIGYHATKNLARLDRGEVLPTELGLALQSVTFGEDLVWVFLAGEVTVDYALRLKRELDRDRLIVSAYANDVPCYVPSERVLAEGGYEAEGAMVYYDRPQRLARGLEQRIVDAVRALVPDEFERALTADASRTGGYAPLTPAAARESLALRADLEVRLAAAEPLVVDPVAIDFGPDGRLWVAEMRDYPEGIDGTYAPGGRVRVLTDDDADGVFDRAEVFLDGIPFPTDVKVWDDGVLVCAAPDVLFAADRDGDGRADEVRTLLTGFNPTNYQARVNSLRWSLDGWLVGANGLLGGTITTPAGARLELGAHDFRIRLEDARVVTLERATGLTQQGRARDDFGRWFGCDNSNLVWHYPLRYADLALLGAPPPPPTRVAAAPDGRLYPQAPAARRFNDPASLGRVTSACGLDVFRDDRLGADLAGDLFVCEPVHNLVRRVELEPAGATFAGRRASDELQREFLASTDPWFRPVQARTGPDGALWIVDMSRWVIEHPRWIDDGVEAGLDLRAGDTLGRIWRVVPRGTPAQGLPDLTALDESELVEQLAAPNGVVRDLAHQLLIWRGVSLDLDHLRKLRRGNPNAGVRTQLLALLSLDDVLATARSARTAEERAWAFERVRDLWHDVPPVAVGALARDVATCLSGLADSDARVRVEAALTARALVGVAEVGHALGARLAAEDEPYARWALLVAAATNPRTTLAGYLDVVGEGDVIDVALLADLLVSARGAELLSSSTIESEEEASAHLGAAAQRVGEGARRRLARAWITAHRRLELGPRPTWVASELERAVELAARVDVKLEDRIEAVAVLGVATDRAAAEAVTITALLRAAEPPALRAAALEAVLRVESGALDEALLACWRGLGTELLPRVLDGLAARPAGALELLERAATEDALAAAIDAPRRRALLDHPDESVRAAAALAFARVLPPDIGAELARLATVGALPADAARGRGTFTRLCATCHALDGAGTALGPDLAALTDRSTAGLVGAVVDPDRQVLPAGLAWTLVTNDGRVLGGLLLEDGPAHVVLVDAGGVPARVARGEIAELTHHGRSFMPAGLLAELAPADVADLLAYLRAPREERKVFPGNAPQLVERDAEDAFDLSADRAELYGPEILFEPAVRCLGYWHGARDRAAWTLANDVPRGVDVWIEWACADASAGARFVLDGLQGPDGPVGAVVAGTGPDWNRYRWRRVGEATLLGGMRRIECRAEVDPPAALFDLRRILLVPRGVVPRVAAWLDEPSTEDAPHFDLWLAALPGLGEAEAHIALDHLVDGVRAAHALLDAYAAGTVARAGFAPRHFDGLLTHPDPAVATRALEWLGE